VVEFGGIAYIFLTGKGKKDRYVRRGRVVCKTTWVCAESQSCVKCLFRVPFDTFLREGAYDDT
jgi:hypothetical protein